MNDSSQMRIIIIGDASSAKKAAEEIRKEFDDVAKSGQAAASKASGGFDSMSNSALKAAQSMGLLHGGTNNLLSGVVGLTAGVAGLAAGIAGVVAGAFALTSSIGASSESIVNMADRTGLTVGQVDRLQAMAKIAGVSVEGLSGSARILSGALEDTSGKGAKAWAALDKLGVSVYDTTGKQREMGQVLFDTLQALSSVTNDAQRTALAVSALGRGAQELQPLIKSFKELDQTVQELGYGTRENFLRDMAKADDELDKLGLRWDILKAKLAVPAKAIVEVSLKVLDAFGGGGGKTLRGDPNLATVPYLTHGYAESGMFRGGSLSPLFQSVMTMGEEADARNRGAAFRASLASTPEGKLDALKEQVAEAQKQALGGVAGAADRYRTLKAQQDAQEAYIQALKDEAAELKRQTEAHQKLAAKGVDIATNIQARFADGSYKVEELKGLGDDGARKYESGQFLKQLADERHRLTQEQAKDQKELNDLNRHAVQSAKDETEYQVRKIELLTQPGGELAAVREITRVRLQGLEAQKAAGGDLFEIERERRQILQDQELRAMQVQRDRIEELKRGYESVFDALIAGGRGLKSALEAMLLAPIKRAGANFFAQLMNNVFGGNGGGNNSGSGGSSGGGFGLGGLLRLGGFSGGNPASIIGPGGTSGFSGPIGSMAAVPGLIGVGQTANGQIGVMGGGGSSGGLKGFGSSQSLYNGLALGGGLLMLNGLQRKNGLSTVSGGAIMGAGIGLSGGPIGLIGGAGIGLAADGLRRGGWGGVGETTAGGALLGFNLGGPIGAVIGAGIGFAAGIVRLFFKGAADKAKDKIKSTYGITISDKGVLNQIVQMAKEQYGGNIDVAIRAPQVRELIELYAMSTNQRLSPIDNVARGVNLQQVNGSVYQAGSYVNGVAYGYGGSLQGITPLTPFTANPQSQPGAVMQLDAGETRQFWTNVVNDGIVANPRAVQSSGAAASASGYRRLTAANSLIDPLAATL